MRLGFALLLLGIGCRKPHQVVLEATADPHPPTCTLRVTTNSSRGPIANVTVDGRLWNSGALGADSGESFAITVALDSKQPDPACDVGLGCRILVDGVEKKNELGARKLTCSVTVTP